MAYLYKMMPDGSVTTCSMEEGLSGVYSRVARDILEPVPGWFDPMNRVVVSTVFLGSPLGEDTKGLPLLFETMIWVGWGEFNDEEYTARYATLDEALAGHQDAVKWALLKFLPGYKLLHWEKGQDDEA